MEIKKFFCLLFLFSTFLSLLSAQAEIKSDLLCGPNSLLVVCQKLGVKTELDELKKLSDYDDKKGTTMAGLAKAAEAKGLYAVGMKLSLDDLAKLKIPIIAYLWDNHCLVIEGFLGNNLRIKESPQGWRLISKEIFSNDYSGFALLVSKNRSSFPKIETKGPDIRFDEYTYDFGEVEQGGKIEHIFKFKNVGNEELVITGTKAFCSCTATIISDTNILPKGEGEIKVTVDTRGNKGFQNQNVYVYFNDPVTPSVQLQIQGIIKTELSLSLRRINLKNFKKGETIATRKIYITKAGAVGLNILKVESSSNYLSTKIDEIPQTRYKNLKQFEIEIAIAPNIPLGKLDEKLTIYTNDEKYPKIEVPVFGNIKGDIEFDPPTFFFGIVKQGEIRESKITVFTTSNAPLKIEKIENPIDCISVAITPKNEGKEYELTASLKDNVPIGGIEGSITIHINNPDQPKIQIPIYALIRE